jgi:hypothetical protein
MEPTTELSLQLVPTPTAEPKHISGNPFRQVIDPEVSAALQSALTRLVEDHQRQVAYLVESDQLQVGSYKEYVELLARFVRETIGSKAGVKYLLDSCGLEGATEETVNLEPELRWTNRS